MAPGDLSGQLAGGNADVIGLPGGVYLRQHGDICQLQFPDKVLKQRLGAGVGMGLEGTDDPLIGHGAGGGQQCMKLPGMMCVVIKHIGAVIGALELKSAPGLPWKL